MIKYVSADDLAERYGVNRSTIWRWQQRGIIPKPVRLSEQCTRWRLDLIEHRDAEREAA
ncbi:MAG: AlpA family phage regulatory protein [Woeseia sp.]